MSEDRLQQWQERRARRMTRLSWLGSETKAGRKPVWFAQNELLVLSDHRQAAEHVLGRLGHADGITETELVPGLLRLRVDGLDVAAAARGVRQAAAEDGDTRAVVSPNHVFVSAPFEHGGPFGPPQPAPKPLLKPGNTRSNGEVPVMVIDTGVWRDSPLPASAYTASAADYENDTDVDHDGMLDGDVGHANFIIGVIAARTQKADVRAVRVLDTFGLCTEADLIAALGRVTGEKLVNLSLGGYTLDDQPPLALAAAMKSLLSGKERLVVAAAGNDGLRDRPFWPAAFAGTDAEWAEQVVAVAAHDGLGLCEWSNAGDWVTVTAPGSDITSTFVKHERFPTGWALWSGTSFATPHVVALLAEQISRTGSVEVALKAVLTAARARVFSGYPGLP
ncbi:subtilisin family serine protease [Allocatelliglobosispora scoriae]|uniref:Subtilisin family serine protease n=2 Tax=Allocatelliglobosispora scoriae TaxID=643052 RepID=A0A841BV17_9ACTN|nr:S8/S53 family peptidase [Allocatelliglobosispora scoriae]MBB5872947.1 subtilisin family serine protease [Allocatelliglobosispora scoriae]